MSKALTGATIRPYAGPDLNAALTVWEAASHVGHPFLPAAFLAQERRNIAELYLPQAETWVFELNGEVIGTLSLVGNEVAGLFVAPDHQRMGAGRALMDKARELLGTLVVEVFAANVVGLSFYRKYGFKLMSSYIHTETGFELLRLSYGQAASA